MDNIQKRYGYTGQGLRVNLTTGKITKEPTFPRFKDEIGGTALGYRVFWDEVPPKTHPLDEANKLVIAPGPFSGSGALCSSRTSITTIYPTIYPMPMIASAHIGGDMAARLKQAGYDFIIIEGKSEKPVYLYINNDNLCHTKNQRALLTAMPIASSSSFVKVYFEVQFSIGFT